MHYHTANKMLRELNTVFSSLRELQVDAQVYGQVGVLEFITAAIENVDNAKNEILNTKHEGQKLR